MDANEIENLQNSCTNLAATLHIIFPNVEVHFLICSHDTKKDYVSKLLQKLEKHAAFDDCYSILRKWAGQKDPTLFLGMVEAEEKIPLSFKSRFKSLAFIAIDTSRYDDLYQAIQALHFGLAEFFDTFESYLKKPTHNGKVFAKRPNLMAAAHLNMKADIYSALQLAREGQYDGMTDLARQRCLEAITPQTHFKPEEYPFPIALDITTYAIEEQVALNLQSRDTSPIILQYKLAEKITNCFDTDNVNSWINFSMNAQTMAWSGYSPSDILGAAVNTSPNAYIKAIGQLAAELTHMAPTEAEHLPNGYNPFLPDEINKITHARSTEEAFEMIMFHVVESESHLPLMRVANNQNEALQKGKILGWCAGALHASAKAFLGAKDRGIPPIQAARLEFQSAYQHMDWGIIQNLAVHITNLQRQGKSPSLTDILRWAQKNPDASFLADSINSTIADPDYTKSIRSSPSPEFVTGTHYNGERPHNINTVKTDETEELQEKSTKPLFKFETDSV